MKAILIPLFAAAALAALAASQAAAEIPEIVNATARPDGDSWRFSVTLTHPDTGWQHYADAWEVQDAAGNILGTRILVHPHVNEQPFTRSLGGVTVPEGTGTVFIRARCLVDGWGDPVFALGLEGEGAER